MNINTKRLNRVANRVIDKLKKDSKSNTGYGFQTGRTNIQKNEPYKEIRMKNFIKRVEDFIDLCKETKTELNTNTKWFKVYNVCKNKINETKKI